MLKLSPDEAALLKAVAADRDNDLPRLVYADFTALYLQHNRISPVGLAALLSSSHLTRCSLHLFGNARLHANAYAVERMLGPRGTL